MAHPFRVTAGQVIVDGYDVHTLARQRVQIDGKRGHEGFALAGAHFGNLALVQNHAADQLHVKMTHAQHALGSLAYHREGFVQQAVQAFSVGKSRLEFRRLGAQLLVAELGDLRFERVDTHHILLQAFEQTAVAAAEYLGKRFCDHKNPHASHGGDPKERQLWRKSGKT